MSINIHQMANLSLVSRASALLRFKNRSILLRRHAATQPAKNQLIDSTHNDSNGITTLSMNRDPVNSLNLDLMTQLRKSLKNSVDREDKGIILTSSLPVFSAGLDLKDMYKPDLQKYTEIWHSFQDLWLTLYGLGVPSAAAINGASPAGGCLLALGCEYRVMVQGDHTIGISGTKLGIVVPKWLRDAMVATIGYRQAELALLRGTLFKPGEALKIGLIDEIATDKNDAISKCEAYVNSYAKISSKAREATKMNLRKKNIDWLKENREWDTSLFLKNVQQPQLQESLYGYLHKTRIN